MATVNHDLAKRPTHEHKGKLLNVRVKMVQTADLLAEGYAPREAAMRLQELTGMCRTTCERYVASVLGRMHADALAEPLESKRQRMLLVLRGMVRKADAAGQYGAVATLLKLKCIVEGLVQP